MQDTAGSSSPIGHCDASLGESSVVRKKRKLQCEEEDVPETYFYVLYNVSNSESLMICTTQEQAKVALFEKRYQFGTFDIENEMVVVFKVPANTLFSIGDERNQHMIISNGWFK